MAADPALSRNLRGGEHLLAVLVLIWVGGLSVWPLVRLFVEAFAAGEDGRAFGLMAEVLSARATRRALVNTLMASAGSVAVSLVLGAALALAGAEGADEVCVIGGGEIYAAALPLADSLDITHILAAIDGDTRFPAIDPAIWREASREDFPAGDKDSHATRHVVYERRT